MADDIAQVQTSLDEIKSLLQNKKKEKGEAVSSEIFTDPRFIEIFESYFKPLVESSKDIKGRLTEKKKISVFDIIGIPDRLQDTKRDAITKELDKLTDKLHNIAKNLGNTKHYTLSDVIGLTRSERATNRRLVNNAIKSLTASINQTAKNLSDPKSLMKFTGMKQIGQQASSGIVEAPVVIRERKKREAIEDSTATPAPTIAEKPKASLAETEKASNRIVPVKLVAVSEEVSGLLSRASRGGPVVDDKGKGTGGDRESYSHSMNAIARNLVLAAGLVVTGMGAVISGIFDSGPLKGVKKMVGSYSLQLATKLGKSILHYMGNMLPGVTKAIKAAFSGEVSAKVAKTIVKSGMFAKAGARILGFLGKVLKKVPGIGALISIGFAIDRFRKGDIQGGLIDLASGAASTIPVVGTAVSIGLDILNAQADLASGGVTANKKGWLGKMNDYLGKMFSKVIYGSLKRLPFGLGEKIAGWMGMDMKGLEASAKDEDANTSTNPELEHAQFKLDIANQVKEKANKSNNEIAAKAIKEGRAKMVSGGIAPSYDVQYTPEELAVMKHNEASIKKANEEAEKAKAVISSGGKPQQKAAAATENATENASAAEENLDETPTVRVDRPFTEQRTHAVPAPSETVDELKRINSNLEQIAAKGETNQAATAPGGSITNVVSAQGGGGSNGALRYVLDATRDTCYTSRERSRNLILDYRAMA